MAVDAQCAPDPTAVEPVLDSHPREPEMPDPQDPRTSTLEVAAGPGPRQLTARDLHPEVFNVSPFVPLRKAAVGHTVHAVNLEGITSHDIDASAYLNADLPIALAVALYLVFNGKKSSTDTLKTGLRRLCDYHGHRRWSELSLVHMHQDSSRIEEECRIRNEHRLKVAEKICDAHRRERRVQAVEHSIAADGAGAVKNYHDAVLALNRFLGGMTRLVFDCPLKGSHPGPRNTGWSRQALTEKQMLGLWQAAACERDDELALLILDLIRETACRIASVCSMNLEDIDWLNGSIIFRTKGDRVHATVVSRDLLMRIAARAERHGWDGAPVHRYNAHNKRGAQHGSPALRQTSGRRLTRKNIIDLFSRCDARIGQLDTPKITAHLLRHTTITQVERIAGEEAAARWAGHRRGPKNKADQTARYVKWMWDERIEILNHMFPGAPHGSFIPSVIANRSAAFADNGQ